MECRGVARFGFSVDRCAQANPLESRVAVAGIGDPRLVARLKQSGELGLGDAEQRAQQPHAVERPDRAHAGETDGSAAMAGAQAMGLALVIAMMRDAEMQDAVVAAIR